MLMTEKKCYIIKHKKLSLLIKMDKEIITFDVV